MDKIQSSVIDTLYNHVSIREYIDKPISDQLLRNLLNSARRSPTSSNLQTYSFIVVRDPNTRKKLAILAGNQKYIETCGVFVAICADISRITLASEIHGQNFEKGLENTLVATVDAAIVGTSLSLAAESVGLGTVMIGAMRNHPNEVGKLLNLPSGVYVVFGLCIGWPDRENVKSQKPRLAEEVIIHIEKYNNNSYKEQLKTYDTVLANHYRSEGRVTPDAAWTGIISKRYTKRSRPELRKTLEEMGFSFE